MTTSAEIVSKIVDNVAASDTTTILDPVQIGEGAWRNELLLFMKPEVFLVGDSAKIAKSVEMVFDKLAEFDAHPAGVAVVGGSVLDELEIMSQHYGLINRLSRTASTMVEDADRQKIGTALGVSLDDYAILGGHEYLKQFPAETGAELDKLWFEQSSSKIRSGFYVRAVEKEGNKIVLVNAFHPEQLAHFTSPSHRIVLVLVHSNTDWATLRNEMCGATFPEKASPRSIRGTLYADPATYGFETVSIANNAVHLSAGPFEALFEIVNFFGKILDLDPARQQPLVLRKLVEAGLSVEQGLGALKNPPVTVNGKATDLFSATEDVDSEGAVAILKDNL